jgi:tRNA G46 methylase TrmB
MLRFAHCLKGRANIRFETDWNKYQEWYQDICCRSAAERIYPPEGEKEFEKKREVDATQFIKKLISHTSPK